MMRMTRKKARRTRVEVKEARRVAVVGGGGKEVEEGTGPMCRREDGCVAVLHNSEGSKNCLDSDRNAQIDRSG